MKCFIITKKHIMLAICIVLTLTVTVVSSASAFADNDRLLPIYCVETDKKQVAISFDAAWGKDNKVQNYANPHNYWLCASSIFLKMHNFSKTSLPIIAVIIKLSTI